VLRSYLLPEERDRWLYVVHNAYLLRWAETGVFGLLSYLWLLGAGVVWAIRCTRSDHDATLAIGAGWCAGLVHLCWEQMWDIGLGGTTPLLFWFMMGTVQAVLTVEHGQHAGTTPALTPRPLRLRRAIA
jgi:O-antigen ligase